jgi:hypothetical protein
MNLAMDPRESALRTIGLGSQIRHSDYEAKNTHRTETVFAAYTCKLKDWRGADDDLCILATGPLGGIRAVSFRGIERVGPMSYDFMV